MGKTEKTSKPKRSQKTAQTVEAVPGLTRDPNTPETMNIDCPTCGSPLVVPENAAGRKAKCFHCAAKFRIPTQTEILDQTVSQMALEALDERLHEHEDELATSFPHNRLPQHCLLYTSPSPRDQRGARMPSSA